MSGCTIPPVGWACTRAAGHEGPCAAIQRQAPVVPAHWNGFGEYSLSFGFEPGGMNINLAGHGANDGDGVFWFAEDDLAFEYNDGKQYRWVGVTNSELLAIRDKLNEVFPPAAQVAA